MEQDETGPGLDAEHEKTSNRPVYRVCCHMYGKEGLETSLAAGLPAGAGGLKKTYVFGVFGSPKT